MAPLGSWLCPEPGVAALPAPPPAGPAAGAPGTWTRAQPPRGKMFRSGEERGEAASQGCTGCLGCPPSLWGPAGWRAAPHTLGGSGFGVSPPLCCRCDVGRASQGSRRLQTPGCWALGHPREPGGDGWAEKGGTSQGRARDGGRPALSIPPLLQTGEGSSAGRQPPFCAQSQALRALHRLPKAKNPTALSKAAPQMGYSTSPELP